MRTRFVQGVGGTLAFTPPELATANGAIPTAATVTLKRASGIDLPTPVDSAAAVVSATGVLSYVLSGAQCPDPLTTGGVSSVYGDATSRGYLYRATWRYTLAGVVYESDQLYEVRRRVLKSTLTYDEIERDLPAPVGDLCQGGSTEVVDRMGDAWDDVLDDLAARGYEPDRVMDPDRLRRPHREKTIARLARGWGPNWRQYAIDREDAYQRALERALGSGDWYDVVADAKDLGTETKTPTITLTR